MKPFVSCLCLLFSLGNLWIRFLLSVLLRDQQLAWYCRLSVCLSVCLCHSAQRQRQINRRHYDGSIWYYCMQQYNRLKNSCNNNAKGLYINVSFHQVCTNRCIPDYTTFTFVFNGNIVDFWKYFYLQAHVIIMYNYVSCVWEICDQLQLQFLTIVRGLFNPQCKGGERSQNFEHTPNAELYSSNVQPNWNM